MRVLLDTQVLLWWLTDSARLRPESRDLFSGTEHELLWSAAATWELGIKMQLGKLRLSERLESFVPRQIAEQRLVSLPIQHDHAIRAATLPPIHRDPFDRMLVAQALTERVPLLTSDGQLAAYGIECLAA